MRSFFLALFLMVQVALMASTPSDSLLDAAIKLSGEERSRLAEEALQWASKSDSTTFFRVLGKAAPLLAGAQTEALVSYSTARWHHRSGDKAYALSLFESLRSGFDESVDAPLRFKTSLFTCIMYFDIGSLDQALNAGLEAIDLAQLTEDPADQMDAYNLVGEIYRSKLDRTSAIEYYDKGLAIAVNENDSMFQTRLLSNKGIALSKLRRFEEADSCLERSYLLAVESDNLFGQALLLTNLGFNKKESGQYQEAIAYYERSLKLKNELGNPVSTAYTLNDIGECLFYLGEYDRSIEYSRRALRAATQADAIYYMKDMSRTLAKTFAKAGIFDSAFHYQFQAQELSDSIFNSDSFREIARLEKAYELREKDLENQLLTQEKTASELELGRQRWISAFAIVLFLAFASIGFMMWRVARMRRGLLEQVEEQNQSLDRTNQSLEELLREQESLFNIVTHDLKGPLLNARQLMELEEISTSAEEKKEVRSKAESSIDHALGFIHEFNAMMELEKSDALPSQTSFDLIKTIQSVIGQFSASVQKKGLTIHFNDSQPFPVNGVEAFVKHMVYNLLSNAVKYSPQKGSIFITVSGSDMARISVEDQGMGIPEGDFDKIFERFYRGAPSEGRERSNGLGLPLVRLLAEKLGGHVKVKSDLGKGTEFTVQFPR